MAQNWRPVVLMHGLDASAEAMSHTEGWIEADFPGIYVNNVEVGNGNEDSWIWSMNKQVDEFAKVVMADPKLAQGFNMIGHSQGGLIVRGYVERYNNPPVHNLITWSGPHGGVYGVPDIANINKTQLPDDLAEIMNELMMGNVSAELQTNCAFCCYWKDVYNYSGYLQENIFLADLNNERDVKNPTYRNNLLSLKNLVLEFSITDMIVVPRQSAWFEMYALGQEQEVIPLTQSDQYIDDWLGLRTVDESGRLYLFTTDCPHQDYPRDQCKDWYDRYNRPFLNNTLP